MILNFKRLDPELPAPRYAHDGDAGLDLFSAEDITLAAGERALVRTGIAVEIPPGYAGFVQPRSGLAARQGLGFVNSPGLIDPGYRGEIKLVAINMDPAADIVIHRGDRVAQLVIQRVELVELVESEELGQTHRGEGGFGSTGHR
ncbi:MAG: dUTP diphosphatase [Coriobacteriia bacterium]